MWTHALRALGALTIAAGAALALATPATASGDAPWEPDPHAVGTLSFYDASGNQVTAGSNVDHLFDYALASSADPAGGSFANLLFANPTPGEDEELWPTTADESSPTPNTSSSTPANLRNTTTPLVSLDSSGAELHAAEGNFPQNTAAGYAGVYQIRLYTTDAANYWAADVKVSGAGAGATWTEVYPVDGAAPTSTSTVLTASPQTSAPQGTQVTFTATETAADSTHPAGTVTFYDGNQYLGSSTGEAVDGNGVATVQTSTLIPGTHTIKADFTPTASGYAPATEATLSYLVNPVATAPTITGTVKVGYTLTCHESSTIGETVSYVWKYTGSSTVVHSGATFALPYTAYNHYVYCAATVSVPNGTPSTASSSSRLVALGNALRVVSKPYLYNKNTHGYVTHGTYEYVNHGTWSPTATSYAYQWYVGSTAIRGATYYYYKIPTTWKGKYIHCIVRAVHSGYATGSYTTPSTLVSH